MCWADTLFEKILVTVHEYTFTREDFYISQCHYDTEQRLTERTNEKKKHIFGLKKKLFIFPR